MKVLSKSFSLVRPVQLASEQRIDSYRARPHSNFLVADLAQQDPPDAIEQVLSPAVAEGLDRGFIQHVLGEVSRVWARVSRRLGNGRRDRCAIATAIV